MRYLMEIDGGQGGSEECEADSLAAAVVAAREWAQDGDWDTSGGTVYCDVRVTRLDEDGDATDETDSVSVGIDRPEPSCYGDGSHDWQAPHEIVGGIAENPGVWGHGGGVTISECCMRCGCRRYTDTWAQRPDTGEQGLREVTYTEGHYAEALATLRAAED